MEGLRGILPACQLANTHIPQVRTIPRTREVHEIPVIIPADRDTGESRFWGYLLWG